MRALGVLALLVALAAPAAGATGGTALVVTYWPDGQRPGARVVWTLRCDPARGSHPHRVRACARLARGGPALFRPTPPDTACAQLYGGPQVALVRGLVQGRRIWARFSRGDGCAIARWNGVAPLLPPGGV